MLIEGTMTLAQVPTGVLNELLKLLSRIAEATHTPYEVWVQGTGATREGKIITLKEWHKLVDTNATARRQFYLIAGNGETMLLRPENDTFLSIRCTFAPDAAQAQSA